MRHGLRHTIAYVSKGLDSETLTQNLTQTDLDCSISFYASLIFLFS